MSRIIDAFTQFLDDNGDPLVNGWLAFKDSGTNTDKATYSDSALTIANTNPVQLDGAGRCPSVFGSGAYKVISYADSVVTPGTPGEQIQQFDPVGGDLDGGFFSTWVESDIYTAGDVVVGSDGNYYRSLTSNNQANNPVSSPTDWEQVTLNRVWNANVTYSSGDSVFGSDGNMYVSVVGSNINNDPTADSGANWKLNKAQADNTTYSNTASGHSATTVQEALDESLARARKNLLINGDGVIVQRTIGSTINDDTYAWDRWIVLSDGNGVVTPSQETSDLPSGARSALKLTVDTANKKFGILQIVEGKNSKSVISDVASLRCAAKSSGISNLRLAILSWDGTEDSVTSDVVSAWEAAGTDPTLVANWTYENVPANLPLTGSWDNAFQAINVAIDTASTKQVAVFIWIDDTDAAISDTLLISQVQLEKGAEATDFEHSLIGEQRCLAGRYYQSGDASTLAGIGLDATQISWVLEFKTEMRTTPTITLTGVPGYWDGSRRSGSWNGASAVTSKGAQLRANSFSLAPANRQGYIDLSVGAALWAADAEL